MLVDAEQIQRVLVNLIENALRHGDGPVLIQISRAGAELLVRVTDRGSGVPAGECSPARASVHDPHEAGEAGVGSGEVLEGHFHNVLAGLAQQAD